MRSSRKYDSFTLIEMLVVIAIISVLAGLLLTALRKTPEHTKRVKCRELISQLASGWEVYLLDNGSFPSESFTEMNSNAIGYLNSKVDFSDTEFGTNAATAGARDPWGEVILLRLDTDLDGVVDTPYGEVDKYAALWSKGQDKQELTEDDIKSW